MVTRLGSCRHLWGLKRKTITTADADVRYPGSRFPNVQFPPQREGPWYTDRNLLVVASVIAFIVVWLIVTSN